MPMWTDFEQCRAFLEERGLATILPGKNQFLPCLLWGARGREGPFEDWDEACERIWQWKDELPGRKESFSGRLWGGQVVLVHRRLLPAFIRWRGAGELAERYRTGRLGHQAWTISLHLQQEARLGRRELRRRAGLAGKARAAAFERGCKELERSLYLTRSGRASEGSGWDSCSYSLVSRHFEAELASSRSLDPRAAAQDVEAALRCACPTLETARLQRLLREA